VNIIDEKNTVLNVKVLKYAHIINENIYVLNVGVREFVFITEFVRDAKYVMDPKFVYITMLNTIVVIAMEVLFVNMVLEEKYVKYVVLMDILLI
jgi:hypothetical protein